MSNYINYATCNDDIILPIVKALDGRLIDHIPMTEVVMLCTMRAGELDYGFSVVLNRFIEFIQVTKGY